MIDVQIYATVTNSFAPMARVRGRFVEGRRDGNQPQLTSDYEAHGCTVIDLGSVGNGVSDLLIGCVGISDLAEVKMPGGVLRDSQVEFNATWRGSKPWKVETRDDVIAHVADMRRRARRIGISMPAGVGRLLSVTVA